MWLFLLWMVLSVCLSSFIFWCHDFKMSHTTFLLLNNFTLYINYLFCLIFVISFKTGTLWSVMFQNYFLFLMKTKNCLQCWVIVSIFIIVGLTYTPLSAEYMFVTIVIFAKINADWSFVYLFSGVIQVTANLQCYCPCLSSVCFCCNTSFVTA